MSSSFDEPSFNLKNYGFKATNLCKKNKSGRKTLNFWKNIKLSTFYWNLLG